MWTVREAGQSNSYSLQAQLIENQLPDVSPCRRACNRPEKIPSEKHLYPLNNST